MPSMHVLEVSVLVHNSSRSHVISFYSDKYIQSYGVLELHESFSILKMPVAVNIAANSEGNEASIGFQAGTSRLRKPVRLKRMILKRMITDLLKLRIPSLALKLEVCHTHYGPSMRQSACAKE